MVDGSGVGMQQGAGGNERGLPRRRGETKVPRRGWLLAERPGLRQGHNPTRGDHEECRSQGRAGRRAVSGGRAGLGAGLAAVAGAQRGRQSGELRGPEDLAQGVAAEVEGQRRRRGGDAGPGGRSALCVQPPGGRGNPSLPGGEQRQGGVGRANQSGVLPGAGRQFRRAPLLASGRERQGGDARSSRRAHLLRGGLRQGALASGGLQGLRPTVPHLQLASHPGRVLRRPTGRRAWGGRGVRSDDGQGEVEVDRGRHLEAPPTPRRQS
jgi:hypothetical protein